MPGARPRWAGPQGAATAAAGASAGPQQGRLGQRSAARLTTRRPNSSNAFSMSRVRMLRGSKPATKRVRFGSALALRAFSRSLTLASFRANSTRRRRRRRPHSRLRRTGRPSRGDGAAVGSARGGAGGAGHQRHRSAFAAWLASRPQRGWRLQRAARWQAAQSGKAQRQATAGAALTRGPAAARAHPSRAWMASSASRLSL